MSASAALRAPSESWLQPRLRDCTPLTDLHLCAKKSADSRLRQLVAWYPTHSPAGKYSTAQGRRTSLSLTETPPHSRGGKEVVAAGIVERASSKAVWRFRIVWYSFYNMSSSRGYLESLVRDTHKTEAEVVAMALETGLRQLWREQILGRYLRGEIPRNAAIESVGVDWVEMAGRQTAAVNEDLVWALDK